MSFMKLRRGLLSLFGALALIAMLFAGSFVMGAKAAGTASDALQAPQSCLQPPASTDLTTLSQADLATYGLAPRPEGADATPARIAQWTQLIHDSRHRICSTVTGAANVRYAPVKSARPLYLGEEASPTSSGVIALKQSPSNYYTNVQADWIVPNPSGPSSGGAAAGATVYIGLNATSDGGGNGNLLQAGSNSEVDEDGITSCNLFWEDYPAPPNYLGHASCGDHVEVHVIESSSHVAQVYVINHTNGYYFGLNPIPSSSYPYHVNGGNAGWIVERPGLEKLANFGTLTFNNAYATPAGTQTAIGSLPTNALRSYTCWPAPTSTCTSAQDTSAFPGPIHGNLWFNDYWVHS